jgi:hypothetical protein
MPTLRDGMPPEEALAPRLIPHQHNLLPKILPA